MEFCKNQAAVKALCKEGPMLPFKNNINPMTVPFVIYANLE